MSISIYSVLIRVCVYIYINAYKHQMFHSIDSTIKESNEHGKSTLDFKVPISSFTNNPCIILIVYYKHILIFLLFFPV